MSNSDHNPEGREVDSVLLSGDDLAASDLLRVPDRKGKRTMDKLKVFIIWSGDISRRVAQALYDWLPHVIQLVDPFMSEEDVQKGSRWANTIPLELNASHFGIVCVTRGNMREPWLNFEAGAVSKVVQVARVYPFLVGLEPSDLEDPLGMFQATRCEKQDVFKLVQSINDASGGRCVAPGQLPSIFDKWWADLQKELDPL